MRKWRNKFFLSLVFATIPTIVLAAELPGAKNALSGGLRTGVVKEDANVLADIEGLAKVLALCVGGAWVYLNTVRGRTFIPRLQPSISGKLVQNKTHQYLLVDLQVNNVGTSIAHVKEKGTGLKISFLRSFGTIASATDLFSEQECVFPVFGLNEEEVLEIEPGTILSGQELIQLPQDNYDAFRLELRVSALRGKFTKTNRKWRALAIVAAETPADVAVAERGEI